MHITPGCTAIVIDGKMGSESPNVGKIVKVGRFVGFVEDLSHADWWVVNKPIIACNGTRVIYYQREVNLEWINDDQIEETNESEQTTNEIF